MSKSISKKELEELVEKFRGNIPMIGKALDKISPNYSKAQDESGRPILKPRTYSAVYKLLERHGLLVLRHKMDTDLDQEIVATAKVKFLQAVVAGQRWAVERVVQSKLGYGNKESLDTKMEIVITKGVLTHRNIQLPGPAPAPSKNEPPKAQEPAKEDPDAGFFEY